MELQVKDAAAEISRMRHETGHMLQRVRAEGEITHEAGMERLKAESGALKTESERLMD
jgi:hypothetical protein